MTKNFCDICGQPAIESMPCETHQLKDQEWSGTKCGGPGSISVVDGRWIPTFSFHLVVRVENLNKNYSSEHIPDLCGSCMAILLEKLTAKVKGKI